MARCLQAFVHEVYLVHVMPFIYYCLILQYLWCRRSVHRGFFGGGHGGTKQNMTLEDIAKGIREREYKRIVVMAGAGISTPSGIPDFR